jgi:hypothetical protein
VVHWKTYFTPSNRCGFDMGAGDPKTLKYQMAKLRLQSPSESDPVLSFCLSALAGVIIQNCRRALAAGLLKQSLSLRPAPP